MNWTKKITAAALTALMVSGLTACTTGADTNWIAKTGDQTIPAGVYLNILLEQHYTQTAKLTADGGEAPKNPLNESIDGKKVSTMITEGARKDLDSFIAAELKFAELGLELSPEVQMQSAQETAMYWSMLEPAYTQNGISQQSYIMAQDNNYKKDALFTKTYGVGGTDEVPLEEIQQKFYADYAKVMVIPLQLSSSEDAAEKADADAKARAAIERFKKMVDDGQDMEDVVFEARKETAADPSTLTQPEKGTSFTFVNREQPIYEQNVVDAIFAAEIGKTITVETEGSVYLFVRYATEENPEDVEKYRISVTFQLRKDAFDAKLTEWAAANAGAVIINEAAIKRYTPNKIKLD